MPGSLLNRNDSTRSDDGKKVSFNRAVRVKNLPQKENKERHFWHRGKAPGEEYHESVLSGSSDDDRNLSPISESPKPRYNMVHRFDEDPRDHSTPKSYVNGNSMDREEDVFYETDFPVHERSSEGPFKTKIIISNDASTHQESTHPPRAYYYNNEDPANFEQSLGEFHRVMDHMNGSHRKYYEDETRSYSPAYERKREEYDTKCKYKYVAQSSPSDPGRRNGTNSRGSQDNNSFSIKKLSNSYSRSTEPSGSEQRDYPFDKRSDGYKYSERAVSSKQEPEEYHYPKNGYKYETKVEPEATSYRYASTQSYAPYKEVDRENSQGYSPATQVTVVRESSTDGKLRNGQNPRVVSRWDSGDQLLADNRETSASAERTDRGQYIRTKGEQSRVWGRREETVYEDQPWHRRAVSHDNLLLDDRNTIRKSKKNGISSSELSVHSKTDLDDKAIQCNGSVRYNTSPIKSENGGRVIKSRNGVVTAFSDVPEIETVSNHTRGRSQDSYLSGEKSYKPEVIYSRVDLDKKKRDRLNNSVDGYSFKTSSRSYRFGSTPALNDADLSSNASSNRERRVKTTKKGFGMKLFGSRRSESPRSTSRYYREDPDSSDTSHIPESVVKAYDHKKKVLNYENVPHSKPRESSSREGSVWFAGSEDDYRRGMAQDEVTCIGASSVVGTDPAFATMSRLEKAKKEDTPLTSYTLDRRHMKERKGRPPTLMLNGNKIRDSSDDERRGPASDTSSVRGGLAAAYQARRRAASRSGSRTRSTPPGSSDGESAHRRRTLVMYIPGVGHEKRAAEEDDRSSGITVARSQSILASRPPRNAASTRSRPSPQLRRRHSIPKSAKFPWFKWRVKAKPSREP